MPTLAVGMWDAFPILEHAHGKRGHGTLSNHFPQQNLLMY